MSAATCAVLTAVFPLVLIAIVVEGRNVAAPIRRGKRYENLVSGGVALTFLGLLVSVIGVQTDGLLVGWAVVGWALFGGSMIVLFAMAALLLGTEPNPEPEPVPLATRRELLADFIRGRRS